MRTNVLDVGFDNVTMEEALEAAMALLREPETATVVTPNPEIVWLCRKDERLRRAVNGASLVLPDGVGILMGAKLLGRPMREKVPGADFAMELMKRLAAEGGSVYLLGAKPGVAEAAAVRLQEQLPELKIAGIRDGYFTEDGPVVEDGNRARPD